MESLSLAAVYLACGIAIWNYDPKMFNRKIMPTKKEIIEMYEQYFGTNKL